MRIPVEAARAYFAHPSQRRGGMVDPDDLHGDGIEYWAKDGVCLAFHDAPWPGVLMVHVGVLPSAWGKADEPAKTILRAAWGHYRPARIVAWAKESNRAVLAFAKRVGFTVDGRMGLPEPVIMQGWVG